MLENGPYESAPDANSHEPASARSLFRIGEVSRLTGTKPFVLRYWETEFPTLQPVKSPKGHRLYRREDVETVRQIKRLLYDEGFTIAGARRHLGESGSIRQHAREDAREDAGQEAREGAREEAHEMAPRAPAAARHDPHDERHDEPQTQPHTQLDSQPQTERPSTSRAGSPEPPRDMRPDTQPDTQLDTQLDGRPDSRPDRRADPPRAASSEIALDTLLNGPLSVPSSTLRNSPPRDADQSLDLFVDDIRETRDVREHNGSPSTPREIDAPRDIDLRESNAPREPESATFAERDIENDRDLESGPDIPDVQDLPGVAELLDDWEATHTLPYAGERAPATLAQEPAGAQQLSGGRFPAHSTEHVTVDRKALLELRDALRSLLTLLETE